MKYGLIGEKLGHSFSKEIHEKIASYDYDLIEIPPEKLDEFFGKKDFKAINVTIPYKEKCMKHLDFISDRARRIGSVNTVVNKDGILYGYNTDYEGMMALILRSKVNVKGKKTVILGSGGTSKTAKVVLNDLGAGEILVVSRTKTQDTITYDELLKFHKDAKVIINTTPVGMYPDTLSEPVDARGFSDLLLAVDAIYNPLYSAFLTNAKQNGAVSIGGLYMLCAQAIRASEKFLDTKYDDFITDKIYSETLFEKTNIALCGMPTCGKTTVGKELAKITNRAFIDTDSYIEEKENMTIKEIFEKYGEKHFRDLETNAIKEISKMTNVIISTGGGAVLKDENVGYLTKNSKIYFLDKPLTSLFPSQDRPLSQDMDSLKKLYNKRYPIYKNCAYKTIDAQGEAKKIAKEIIKNHMLISEDL